MSHQENWKNYLVFAKESRGNHVSDAILAADRIVRAAVAERKRCLSLGCGCALDRGSDCAHKTLCRAVENFEKEGKG